MGTGVLCRNAYIAPGGAAYGCGQCIPCRINKRREWTHRLLLEQRLHTKSSFVTLSYADENLPLTDQNLQTLDRKHLTDFLKRLRWHIYPEKVRYFGVGEYGTQSQRPHYHLALFNFPTCSRGATSPNRYGNCCSVCSSLSEVWGLGIIHSAELSDHSAAYICGYVTKKLTNKGDLRLNGRKPEFATMSLKPGIGAGFIPDVASELLTHGLERGGRNGLHDVPNSLREGSRVRPLGRYLTQKLRTAVGQAPNAPPETIQLQKEKLQPLQEMAQKTAVPGTYRETYSELIRQENEGHYQRQLAKGRIYKKRESL